MLRRRSCTEMCVSRPARQLAADAAPAPEGIRATRHIWLPLVPHIGLGAGRSPGCCPSGRTGPTAHPSPACRNDALLRADAAAEALPGAVPWWRMPFSVSERLVMSAVGRTDQGWATACHRPQSRTLRQTLAACVRDRREYVRTARSLSETAITPHPGHAQLGRPSGTRLLSRLRMLVRSATCTGVDMSGRAQGGINTRAHEVKCICAPSAR